MSEKTEPSSELDEAVSELAGQLALKEILPDGTAQPSGAPPTRIHEFYEPTGYRDGEPIWSERQCKGTEGLRAEVLRKELVGDPKLFVKDFGGQVWGYDALRNVWRGEPWAVDRMRDTLEMWLGDSYRQSILALMCDMLPNDDGRHDFTQMNSDLLNLPNTMLEWRTDALLPHTPKLMSCAQLGAAYDPDAVCPQWQAFLDQMLPCEASQEALQMTFGAAVVGGKLPRQAVFLFGTGHNGKSVACKVLRSLLGEDNVSEVKFQSLDTDSHKFASAAIEGKLANIHPDLPDTAMRSSDTFKVLTGNDGRIEVERKHKDAHLISVTALLVFAFNSMPKIYDDSVGMWDRVVLIPFDVRIDKKDKDENLSDKLFAAEASGILNWAIAGARKLDASAWVIPDDPGGGKQAWMDRSMPAAAAVRELLVKSDNPKASVPRSEFNATAERWAAEVLGMRVKTSELRTAVFNEFGDLLKTGGVMVIRPAEWSDAALEFTTPPDDPEGQP